MRLLHWLRRAHADERGLKTIEAVALLALAAIALVLIQKFWFKIQNWFVDNAAEADEGWETGTN